MNHVIKLLIIPVVSITIAGLTSNYLTHSNFINGVIILAVTGINTISIALFSKGNNKIQNDEVVN